MELLQDIGHRYQDAFGAEDASGALMRRAVLRWLRLYLGEQEDVLRLPYTMVRKLSRAVLCEYKPEGFAKQLPAREAMELAMIGGECYLRPGDGMWQAIGRGSILIFARDHRGEPTDVGLVEKSQLGRQHFTLLERRTHTGEGLRVRHRLYRSNSRQDLGREVPLKAHPAYAQLPEMCLWPQNMGVGLVRLKMPMTNCIDGSHEGVAVYAAAEPLLKAISENELQLQGEFRRGQSRLVVSRDMLREGQLQDSLFVGLDESPESVGITVFSPQLREQSYLNRQQAYLRALENLIGLKRGLLSQVEAVDRTATEITSSEGEYMGLIKELQGVWQAAADSAAALQEALTGEMPDWSIAWGDGVLNN